MSLHWHSFPVAHFDPCRIAAHLAPQGPGFLESAASPSRVSRWTLVPLRTRDRFVLTPHGLQQQDIGSTRQLPGDPFAQLNQILRARRQAPAGCPSPFPGGFFGWFAYDLAAHIERLPRQAVRDLPLPDLWLDWVDLSLAYDAATGQAILSSLDPGDDLPQLAAEIHHILDSPHAPPRPTRGMVRPDLTAERFTDMVRRAQDLIAAGDIYQANLSCRFAGKLEGHPLDLYRQLRAINPSPFACFLTSPAVTLISSSPERLVSLDLEGLAETRPIAGTRRRGQDHAEDAHLGAQLLAHPKERAEHVMLLDLERNDLGKVCQTGSVEVDELMVLERYSHVTHIVSNVRGRLDEGVGPFDLVRAMFPGGTITGVPKKRCMEIIDSLEPTGRGLYTGSAGYIAATGAMDLNILIRSFQLCGSHLSYQVGAGIVADSIPHAEWQECLAKGQALQKALTS